MKKSTRPSIDGFVPRRATTPLGTTSDRASIGDSSPSLDQTLRTGDSNRYAVGVARESKAIGRSDISDSLREIDDAPEGIKSDKKSRRQRRRDKKAQKPKSKARRIIKWIALLLLLIVLGVGGYVAFKAFIAGNSVFRGSVFDLVQSQPLKEDANGRSNFLVFGTAEDDEGGTHSGANLTDSIMVISVDQDKKDAYLVSLPRDLWISYQETCVVGNQGKLNAAYFCASDDGMNEAAGADALRAKAGEILGLDVQYYVHLNFTAVVQAVDAVGGVELTIESEDPRGILDRNFDWKCNYKCYYVNYKNGEKVTLDGERALALARARNASGGYGLPNGNFDREKNQQKVIKALREKAVSAGTLTNLGSVTGLIDALGDNLRTNIETKEFRTLMSLASTIPSEKILPLSLVDEEDRLVTTGNINGQSVVRPIAGLYDYSDIKAYVNKNLNSGPVVKEEPHITVLNGGAASGMAQNEADRLIAEGFMVDTVDNAPEGTYPAYTIYQINASKTASAAKLKELYGVTIKTTAPPVSVVGDTDFLIIIGTKQ
jgi:polyisoprenyl-teichoic acid--peptidoglycan teichoic acid transferase